MASIFAFPDSAVFWKCPIWEKLSIGGVGCLGLASYERDLQNGERLRARRKRTKRAGAIEFL